MKRAIKKATRETRLSLQQRGSQLYEMITTQFEFRGVAISNTICLSSMHRLVQWSGSDPYVIVGSTCTNIKWTWMTIVVAKIRKRIHWFSSVTYGYARLCGLGRSSDLWSTSIAAQSECMVLLSLVSSYFDVQFIFSVYLWALLYYQYSGLTNCIGM